MVSVESVRANEEGLKVLELNRSPEEYFANNDVSELVDAMSCNTNIECVRMEGAFLRGLSQRQRGELFRCVARLSSLEKVYVVANDTGCRVCVSHLGDLLEYARGLTVLSVERVDLEGREEEFSAFQVSLFRHRNLREFVMVDFTLVDTDLIFIDRVVQVLALIPTLAVVKLRAAKEGNAHFDGSSLQGLLTKSKTLRELHISQFFLDGHGVKKVAKAIKTSKTPLRILSLPRVGLDDDGATRIAAALEQQDDNDNDDGSGGSCCLEVLDLRSNDIGNEGCLALARSLRRNAHVHTVRLTGNKNIGNEGLAAMADVLHQKDNALKTLEMPITNSEYNGKQIRSNGGGAVSKPAKRSTAMAA